MIFTCWCFTCEYIMLHSKMELRSPTLRWGGYPSGPNRSIWAHKCRRRRQMGRWERYDVMTWPAISGFEDDGRGPWTKQCGPLEAGNALSWEPARKQRNNHKELKFVSNLNEQGNGFSPGASRKEIACWWLDFSLMRPVQGFWPTELRDTWCVLL